jgi:quercetin dioxygenase-like cupin family protein
MHLRHRSSVAALCASALLAVCSPLRAPAGETAGTATRVAAGEGLILQASEGERRVRRPRPGAPSTLRAPFILKVDRRNGGSSDLVMGYEDIPPGQAIQPHRHLHADEIIFVHQGSGIASLGSREAPISAGATIYIPRDTRISLRNRGSGPLGIAFVFSRPGFEELMRENSVPEGQPATPVSPEEFARNRARNRWHTVYDEP